MIKESIFEFKYGILVYVSFSGYIAKNYVEVDWVEKLYVMHNITKPTQKYVVCKIVLQKNVM